MKRFIIIIAVTFVVLSAVFYAMSIYAPAFHFFALEVGNIIMALLAVISYFLVKKQLAGNPHAFVRGVYSASLLKLMVCMISILLYVLLNREHIHKPSVFVLFGVYAIYTGMETWVLSKIVKK